MWRVVFCVGTGADLTAQPISERQSKHAVADDEGARCIWCEAAGASGRTSETLPLLDAGQLPERRRCVARACGAVLKRC
jgi:hypothetical protein